MIKTETETEENDHADYFSPRVQTVNPGIFIEVEEDVHHSHRRDAENAKKHFLFGGRYRQIKGFHHLRVTSEPANITPPNYF
jgi:hypothetical protein